MWARKIRQIRVPSAKNMRGQGAKQAAGLKRSYNRVERIERQCEEKNMSWQKEMAKDSKVRQGGGNGYRPAGALSRQKQQKEKSHEREKGFRNHENTCLQKTERGGNNAKRSKRDNRKKQENLKGEHEVGLTKGLGKKKQRRESGKN